MVGIIIIINKNINYLSINDQYNLSINVNYLSINNQYNLSININYLSINVNIIYQ